jgi:hypothetical protein
MEDRGSMSVRVKIVLWLVIAALLVQVISARPVSAQRRAAPKKPPVEATPQQAVSLDILLAADTYKIYGEVRNVGQLIRSDGVKDLVDPVLKLTEPPKEFKSLVKFLNTRADALLTSRLLFAAMPSRPKLPQALVAIEFASAEEAQKFEPQLRDFLPKFLPAPAPTPAQPGSPAIAAPPEAKQNQAPPAPSFVLKQVGQLVFITDAPFALKDLKPRGSKLLAEDQSFRMAHERFTTDSVFLYVDLAGIQRDEEKDRTQRAEAEQKRMEEAQAQLQKKPEETTPEETPPPPEIVPAEAVATPNDSSADDTESTELKDQPKPDPIEPALTIIASSFFQAPTKWPDGIGASLNFDGDAYVLRVLLVNTSPEKPSAIPFFPRLISGPLIAPDAPSVLPADTELFVSASLDLPQIHDTMVRESKQFEQMAGIKAIVPDAGESDSPFTAIEKRLGIKLKEEVLPLLGNEIAVTIPMSVIDGGPPSNPKTDTDPKTDQEQKKVDQAPSVVIAISVKDREGVKALLPKIIDSVGAKGASMLAQTEKRDDTELVVYADAFAYALVGNFLVLSPDVKATRHVVDSYLKHETLSSNTNFRNYTRWQPRQVLGQVYLSPVLMESYNTFALDTASQISEQLRDFLTMVRPVPQPVTYSLVNEGQGPLHELHLPKNLVLMLAASAAGSGSEMTLNEGATQSAMHVIGNAQATFQSNQPEGRYGSLDELIKAGLVSSEITQNYGYKFQLKVSGTHYEVTAVPVEYGKTGKLSFFIDETGVLRGDDHAGAPATSADKELH